MVTMQQAQNGLIKYIDTEIIPHVDGLKKIGLSAYVTLAAGNVQAMLNRYIHHPAVEVLGVIDSEGNVDIDALYKAISPMLAEGKKVTIYIPLVGDFSVDKSDLEKLYRYMKE